jgi:DNA-binding MarR family transcriptional regulator
MNSRQSVINELFKLVALLENSGDFIFAPIGLTVKTYAVLSLISTGIDTSRDLLAGTYGSKPNMTKKLKFLEENGFIQRFVDEHDKRVFRFSLTKKSYDSLKKI